MSTLKRIPIFLLFALLAACSKGGAGFSVFASPTPVPPTGTPVPPTPTPVPAAATVNGEAITLDEFNAELNRYKAAQAALGNTVSDQDASRIVLNDLISQVLLSQGAAEAGFVVDAATLQARIDALTAQVGGAEALKAWINAHGYTEESFRVALKRAAAAAWMRDRIISSVPSTAEQVHVRQILLYNEEVAKSYYSKLQDGADFDELATLVDPVTRGDIGWFPRGYLTEKAVEDAAFSLEAGAYSPIIPSEVGFHIIKLLEKQADRPLTSDALLALQSRALDDWLENRRKQSTIVLSVQ
jgi:peptidyl-prolyl cis-trans isomerase C